MSFNKIIGIIGAQLLAWCGAPAVYQVVKQGHAEGYSLWFLLIWWLGEVLSLIYVSNKDKDLIQLINYILNLAFISILIYYVIKN